MANSLVEAIDFWVNGVCTCFVVIIGVILNCIAILIIRKRFEKANIFYQMLISLLCLDILVLVTWTNLSLVLAFKLEHPVLMHMFPYFSFPSTYIAITSSTFMTTTIAFERYLAVRDPLKYSQHMKTPKLQEKRLRLYLFIVIALSLVINLPHFMEFEVRYVNEDIVSSYDNGNSSIHPCIFNDSKISNTMAMNASIGYDRSQDLINESEESKKPFICYTAFGEDANYLYYYRFWIRLLTTGAIPFGLLVIFNVYIYTAMKRIAKRRDRLTASATMGSNRIETSDNVNQNRNVVSERQLSMSDTVKRKDEENLSLAFVGICSVFLVCHSLKIGLNLADGLSETVGGTALNQILGSFSNLLIVLNSAVNMVIYCVMNNKFRNYFLNAMKNVISCNVNGQQQSNDNFKNLVAVPTCQIQNQTEVIEMTPLNKHDIE